MVVESLSTGAHIPLASANEHTSNGIEQPKDAPWIVQKFGGTSVGKFPVNIAENIIKTSLEHSRIAVVCSARSSYTKPEGTTNRLLRAAREAQRSNVKEYENIVNFITEDHIKAARQYIKSAAISERLVQEINKECQDLILFLEAIQRVTELSVNSEDRIISKGEKLSCRFLTALLQDRGVSAEYVDVSDIITFPVLSGIDQGFYRELSEALAKKIGSGNKVPVITGYFGSVPGGLLDKIGRGYTDLCAALVAVGLKAKELQVWKEVDGIYTADPRIVPTAEVLSRITPGEAAELTFYGSEVIHPFTMEQVIRASIPIRIKNVIKPRGDGTIIIPETESDLHQTFLDHDFFFRKRSPSNLSVHQRPKRPTAVTFKDKILVLNVHSNKRSLSHGFFAKIFSTLDKWRLSVDLISTSEVHVSMAVHSETAFLSGGGEDEVTLVNEGLRGAIGELREFGTVDVISEMAIVSLVGKQMKNMIGIAGKMFSTLGENNVNIEMISQGASEISISCVIEERDAERAINILHTNLFTFLDC